MHNLKSQLVVLIFNLPLLEVKFHSIPGFFLLELFENLQSLHLLGKSLVSLILAIFPLREKLGLALMLGNYPRQTFLSLLSLKWS